MTAGEARQIALSRSKSDLDKSYEEIKKFIATKVSGGKLETYYSGKFSPELRERLENEGYRIIETSDGRNGTDVKISW